MLAEGIVADPVIDLIAPIPDGVQPRRWQQEALEKIANWLPKGEPPSLVRAVTGAGKSFVISALASRLASDRSVLVTVPTQSLVEQTAATIEKWCKLGDVGRFYARKKESWCRIVVCCMPSVKALLDERQSPFELWIVDEAHRSEARQILSVVDALGPDVPRLGFTATPFRTRQSERLSLFEHILYDYGPSDALRDGVVVPLVVEPYVGNASSLDEAALEIMQDAIRRGPTIVNARDIKDAEAFANLAREAGIRAEAVHSKQKPGEQKRLVDALREGDIDALVHVSLLAEGVDMPWLVSLVARRPVSSRIRWIQEIGRVLRVAPGKSRAFLYDLLDQWTSMSLSYDAVLGADPRSPSELLAAAEEAVINGDRDSLDEKSRAEFERALGAAVENMTPETVTPLQRIMRRMASECEQWSARPAIKSKHWRALPPSDKQIALFKRWMAPSKKAKPWEWVWIRRGASEAQRDAIRAASILAHEGVLDRGTTSDLITVLLHPREHGNKWMPWRRERQDA